MFNYLVTTTAGRISISATCEEAARLDLEEQGQGTIINISRVEGPHE